ncbi:diguanylate cyclase domain-containing protein [Halobacillus yeomjeoni]|uniref:Diguanylate cyclase n=1 Tax=Halobacillus yeomjeoni TaxID=311194 RepID=A0A931HUY0_9BACI|nr:sensor domain-containing diguanylate cyclase [Halobacillus yeomjeoni]MBH0230167.1 diguanylate cyclase [Halobacillus yeomjeoni]
MVKEWEKRIVVGKTDLHLVAFPLGSEGKYTGFIVVGLDEANQRQASLLNLSIDEITKFVNKMILFSSSMEETRKNELLYTTASKFHSFIDTNEILHEIIITLQRIYPDFHYCLLVSQDYTLDEGLPVKQLAYDNGSKTSASMKAYLSGDFQIEDRTSEGKSYLFAPIRGRQGVYGVLQVDAKRYLNFPDKVIDFFVSLAKTAGNALENAHLYQQSRKLNNDLQLINSTSHHLNANMCLSDKIEFMSKKIKDSFQADEVSFLCFEEESGGCNYKVLEGSTSYFSSVEAKRFVTSINSLVKEQKEPLFIGDLSESTSLNSINKWSVMAVPMTDYEQFEGLALVIRKKPYFFTFDDFKLLQSLVQHSTLAFANSLLREKLEKNIITDYLTQLHSRYHLDQCIERHLAEDDRGHFLLYDIDNFKQINDCYGHQTGDEVLRQVADAITRKLGSEGLAARWGGEELAVYLPHMPSEEAETLAESIRKEVSEHSSPCVTVSGGMVSWSRESKADAKEIFQEADTALYEAKKNGKNIIVFS